MKADLFAGDVAVRLAKIRLRLSRAMAQGNEHLARTQKGTRHILAHDRVAAGKSLFIPQTIENPLRRTEPKTQLRIINGKFILHTVRLN
ncbi:hypothetical protein IYY11_00180 [Methylocystis sp. H62]|nr:hypothetical protein [Methylocystis sp. H62]